MEQTIQTPGGRPWGHGLRTHGLVLAYYTVLSILLTYPWILYFTRQFPGEGGDLYVYIWHFWFFKKQVLSLQNPFFTDYIFFPTGSCLFFTSYTLLHDLLATLLMLFTSNIVLVSNILFLLTFILAGYCAFLLVDYLTQNRWAALLAGTIFAFCPYHFARLLGHFDLMIVHWIPLFILFFLKMNSPQGTYRHALLAGVCAVLALFDSAYYYGLFLVFFVMLFYLYHLIHPEQRGKYFGWPNLKKAAVLAGTSLALAAPFMIGAYVYAKAGYYDPVAGWIGANDCVSDVTAFFLPSFRHPIWGEYLWEYYSNKLAGMESVVFIGWLVTVLVIFASLYLCRRRPELRLWRFLFFAFVILSLGPTLHMQGEYLFDMDGEKFAIPLPYFLLHYIPLLGNARAPSRLSIMFMLCAAVLSAYVCIWIQEKMPSRRRAFATVFVLLTLGILFEYLNVPYPLCRADTAGTVFERLAEDKSPGTVLELPLFISDGIDQRGDPSGEGFETYTQIVHNKRRIGGYTSRGVRKALSTIERFPVIQKLLDIEEGNPIRREELEEDKTTVLDLVKEVGLKYIIVYPDHRDKPCFEYVSQVFSLGEPIYTDSEGHEVYQISEASLATAASRVVVNYLRTFWGGEFLDLEADATSHWRWCGSHGELTLVNPSTIRRIARLSMEFYLVRPDPYAVVLEGEDFRDTVRVDGVEQKYERIISIEPKGRMVINLYSDAPPFREPPDPRPMVFAVHNFEVKVLSDAQ